MKERTFFLSRHSRNLVLEISFDSFWIYVSGKHKQKGLKFPSMEKFVKEEPATISLRAGSGRSCNLSKVDNCLVFQDFKIASSNDVAYIEKLEKEIQELNVKLRNYKKRKFKTWKSLELHEAMSIIENHKPNDNYLQGCKERIPAVLKELGMECE